MFFLKEYNNYVVKLHVNDKVRFYNYKYFNSLKSIVLLIDFLSLRYHISPLMYDDLNLVKTNLYFFYYFNNTMHFNHFNNNNDSYVLYLNNNYIYQYNYFYNIFISYLKKEFNNLFFIDIKNSNSNNRTLKFNFNKLVNMPSNSSFNEIKTNNSLITFTYKTNTSNYYFNRILLSHTLFNIK